MRYLGYKEKIVRLLEALYRGTECAVRVEGGRQPSVRNDGWRVTGLHFITTSIQHLAGSSGSIGFAWTCVGASISGINILEIRFADDTSLMAWAAKSARRHRLCRNGHKSN